MLKCDSPYHLFEKHYVYADGKSETYERIVMKNNKIHLRCPSLLLRKEARAIVKLLNDLASDSTKRKRT